MSMTYFSTVNPAEVGFVVPDAKLGLEARANGFVLACPVELGA